MHFTEIILLAIGVAMDAFAASICKGIPLKKVAPKHAMLTAIWFGGFQALLPLIGYYLGASFSDFVSSIDHWIAFLLLGIIGISMLRESFQKDECSCGMPDFSVRAMFPVALATSIDAMAVGVSLSFTDANIWEAVLAIGIITAMFSGAGVYIGNMFGNRYKSKAEMTGGLILVVMGVKILLEHTLS